MVYSPSGSGNTHIDEVLTQISVGFPNNGLVGDVLFPSVTVNKQSDKYYIFGREQWLPEDDLRAPGTVANEIAGLAVSVDTYYAQEHSLQVPVTDEERENVDSPLAPDRDATELVTSKIMLGRERAIQQMATTAANYVSANTVTLSGTDQWNDYANSDPIDDFKVARRAIHAKLFMEPTKAMIPWLVMSTLEDHPDFIEHIKYSQTAIVTEQLIARVLGIGEVVIPGAGYNSARMGQAESLAYIWGKDVVLAWVPGRAGLKLPAYAYEFTWSYPGGGVQVSQRWREEKRKSDIVRVSRRYDLKFIAVDASDKSIVGYVIKAAIA